MDTSTLKQFESRLKEQRAEILFNQKKQQEMLELAKDDLLDETDLSRTELEQGMQIRLRSREAVYLRKIEAALTRIKHGSFGQCVDCEEEIDIGRMMARPTTTLCIPCKEAQEHSERGYIDNSVGRKRNSSSSEPMFFVVNS